MATPFEVEGNNFTLPLKPNDITTPTRLDIRVVKVNTINSKCWKKWDSCRMGQVEAKLRMANNYIQHSKGMIIEHLPMIYGVVSKLDNAYWEDPFFE